MSLLISALVAGAAMSGTLLLLRAVWQPATPLEALLAELDRPVTSPPIDRRSQIGRRLAIRTGWRASRVDEQLRIIDKTADQHAYEKLIASIAGFILPIAFSVALQVGGIQVNWWYSAILALALAVVGFLYPDLPLADKVAQRQSEVRFALSNYLDLVSILSAGGAGIESALQHAANAGEGRVFDDLRGALRRAQVSGETPWQSLDELGERLGVEELCELSATIAVAGTHGGRIRQSLTAKADALRAAQAARVEELEEQRSEKMVVPVSVMVLGLVMFVGFGAVQAINSGTSDPVEQPAISTPVDMSATNTPATNTRAIKTPAINTIREQP